MKSTKELLLSIWAIPHRLIFPVETKVEPSFEMKIIRAPKS